MIIQSPKITVHNNYVYDNRIIGKARALYIQVARSMITNSSFVKRSVMGFDINVRCFKNDIGNYIYGFIDISFVDTKSLGKRLVFETRVDNGGNNEVYIFNPLNLDSINPYHEESPANMRWEDDEDIISWRGNPSRHLGLNLIGTSTHINPSVNILTNSNTIHVTWFDTYIYINDTKYDAPIIQGTQNKYIVLGAGKKKGEVLIVLCKMVPSGSFRGVTVHRYLAKLEEGQMVIQNEIIDPYPILNDNANITAVHFNSDGSKFSYSQIGYIKGDFFAASNSNFGFRKGNSTYNIYYGEQELIIIIPEVANDFNGNPLNVNSDYLGSCLREFSINDDLNVSATSNIPEQPPKILQGVNNVQFPSSPVEICREWGDDPSSYNSLYLKYNFVDATYNPVTYKIDIVNSDNEIITSIKKIRTATTIDESAISFMYIDITNDVYVFYEYSMTITPNIRTVSFKLWVKYKGVNSLLYINSGDTSGDFSHFFDLDPNNDVENYTQDYYMLHHLFLNDFSAISYITEMNTYGYSDDKFSMLDVKFKIGNFTPLYFNSIRHNSTNNLYFVNSFYNKFNLTNYTSKQIFSYDDRPLVFEDYSSSDINLYTQPSYDPKKCFGFRKFYLEER